MFFILSFVLLTAGDGAGHVRRRTEGGDVQIGQVLFLLSLQEELS